MSVDLDDLLRTAVVEVFGTMLGLEIHPEPPSTPIPGGSSTIAAAVGFIGSLNGLVYIYAAEPFAVRITDKLIGLNGDRGHRDEMVNDSMGELANMIVGHFKSRLSDRGNSCSLTIPSIVRGTSFQIEPVSSSIRRVISFRSMDTQLVAELMLRPE